MFSFPASGRIFPNRNAITAARTSSRRNQKKAVRRRPQAKKMDHQKLTKSCSQYVKSASRGAGCLCRKDLFQMLLLKTRQRAEIHKRMIYRLQFVVQLLRPPQRGTRLRRERTAQRGGAADFLSLCVG